MSDEQKARLLAITGDPDYIPVSLKVCKLEDIDNVLSYLEWEKAR